MGEQAARCLGAEGTRELNKVGIILLSERNLTLECVECGQIWSPTLREGGQLPSGYWKCTNGCNAPGV